jgi:F-type H+-transporting ATPase subunit epsilon
VAVNVRVVTPERELWAGEGDIVIARGTEGEVGIMGGHAPMLLRLAISALRVRQGSEQTVVVVDGGFLHVVSDEGVTRVDVLADHGVLAHDIDVEAVRREKSELEERMRQEIDDGAAQARLARELAMIDIRLGVRE